MIREAKIYIGDASKFNPENYYTIPGVTVNDDGEVFNSSGEKMKTEIREGYKYVRVMINGKEKLCKVHRIVACSFQDICGEFNEVVNHLDEDKFNNKANNLRWTTAKENNAWGTVMDRRRKTVEATNIIKNIIKNHYVKNHIMYYPRGIKVTKLKYEYKVVDKNNSLTLYIPFSEVQEKM